METFKMYKVVSEKNPSRLEESVKKLLNENWFLVGGLAMIEGTEGYGNEKVNYWCQALAK